MKFFWPIYFLTAVVSTAGVYVAAPLARPYVEAVFGKPKAAPSPVSSGADPSGGLLLKTVAPPPPAEAEPAPSRPAKPAAAEEGDEMAPSMNGIYLVSRGDKPGWGITNQRTTYYGLDGSRLGHVAGGVLLDFKAERVSSIGNMVECVLLENGKPSVPRLVSKKDVYLFTGSYAKLSDKQRADLQAYYAFNGQIGARKDELLQAAAAKNPFFATYSQAYRAYTAHLDAAKALTVKRDHATEQDKTRLEEQLREMKMAETALRTEYEAAHTKFRSWKEQHAAELAKAEDDPDVKKWTQEMAALRRGILGLGL